MTEPLGTLLAGTGEPALVELRAALRELAGVHAIVVDERELKRRVYRVRLATAGGWRRLILKRMDPVQARRTALAVERWLPAVGLDGAGPPLAAVAAARAGDWVWHVYEDLGDAHLAGASGDDPRVRAAAELIAALHVRFADHPLLPECRAQAGDLGIRAFETNVRDLGAALGRILRAGAEPEHAALCERLIARMDALLAQRDARAEALDAFGGPETLLHGDLWTTNAFVLDGPDGPQARLIDWDHAGVGPAAYDLSTFLSRFPPADRPPVLAAYRAAVERAGLALPSAAELALAFDTAERGRLAGCGLWPAVAVLDGAPEWGWRQLAAVAEWLDELEPVLA